MSVLKPFADHGHYTAVHDAVFDVVMPYCPPNAFKVLMFVLRKTRGWKKEEDVLRYAEIKTGTGIKSDTTLAKELDFLLRKSLLLARSEDGTAHVKGERKAPAYSINRDFELSVEASETGARPTRSTPENEVVSTPETGASNNQLSQEPSVGEFANAHSPSGEPQNVEEESEKKKPERRTTDPVEKYVTDRMYEAAKAAGYRQPNESYPYHLGRAKDMLAKDQPTDDEIEALPAAFVRLFEVKGRADACSALVELRRQRGRERVIAENSRSEGERPKDEQPHPQSEAANAAREKPRRAAWYSAFLGGSEAEWQRRIDAGATHNELMGLSDAA